MSSSEIDRHQNKNNFEDIEHKDYIDSVSGEGDTVNSKILQDSVDATLQNNVLCKMVKEIQQIDD